MFACWASFGYVQGEFSKSDKFKPGSTGFGDFHFQVSFRLSFHRLPIWISGLTQQDLTRLACLGQVSQHWGHSYTQLCNVRLLRKVSKSAIHVHTGCISVAGFHTKENSKHKANLWITTGNEIHRLKLYINEMDMKYAGQTISIAY